MHLFIRFLTKVLFTNVYLIVIKMPPYCIVPKCSSRMSVYRFPSDEQLRKKWLLALKRDKYEPSKYDRICPKHFVPSDYVLPEESIYENPKPRLKKDAVPSQFNWIEKPTKAKQRRECVKKRPLLTENMSSMSSSSKETLPEIGKEIEIPIIVPRWKDRKIQNGDEIETVLPPEWNGRKVRNCDVSTQTYVSTRFFCIENLQSDLRRKELNFYTGFNSGEHFWLVFNILGPAVNHLVYYQSGCSMHVRNLTPANEFLLTIVKLRRNTINKELALQFDISELSVSRIFITWINFLYCQFKELNIWTPFKIAEKNLKFKGRKCTSTVFIDCTEIKIEQPNNPISQQLTYSTSKSSNTLKVLIGVSCTGCITFISDSYGGSISDRCLFEECGLSDLLDRNDIVLADRGFHVQDILDSKGLIINMPEFRKQKADQLELEQHNLSNKMSSDRTHVQRVIGLAKKYRILTVLSSNLVPLGSRIIFVCFMLANFHDVTDGGKIK